MDHKGKEMSTGPREFLAKESELLRQNLEKLTMQWPPPFPQITQSLIEQVGFRPHSSSSLGWTGQFDALTILFPMLLADLLPENAFDLSRKWGVVHALYMIHSILDDRILDGQLKPNSPVVLYNRLVLLQAEHLFHSLAPNEEQWWITLHHDYLSHQAQQDSRLADSVSNASELEESAYGRAALGLLAGCGMLSSAGARASTVERVWEAYKPLVIALQWCDDVEDWEEDLKFHRPNLLLAQIGTLVRQTIDDLSDSWIGEIRKSLFYSGALANAFRRAADLMKKSASLYEHLGAVTVARLILDKSARIEERTHQYAVLYSTEILDILDREVSQLTSAMAGVSA